MGSLSPLAGNRWMVPEPRTWTTLVLPVAAVKLRTPLANVIVDARAALGRTKRSAAASAARARRRGMRRTLLQN
jgi:hypothetical protein